MRERTMSLYYLTYFSYVLLAFMENLLHTRECSRKSNKGDFLWGHLAYFNSISKYEMKAYYEQTDILIPIDAKSLPGRRAYEGSWI